MACMLARYRKMSFKPLIFAVGGLLFVGMSFAHATSIEFGEVRTRFEVESSGKHATLLRPWRHNWRHTYAWQRGSVRAKRCFAPKGCFIRRSVSVERDHAFGKTVVHRPAEDMYICR